MAKKPTRLTRVQARRLCKLLADGHDGAIALFRSAMKEAEGSPTQAATALGFAGPSTIWRIAARSRAFRAILAKLSCGPGRKAGEQ